MFHSCYNVTTKCLKSWGYLETSQDNIEYFALATETRHTVQTVKLACTVLQYYRWRRWSYGHKSIVHSQNQISPDTENEKKFTFGYRRSWNWQPFHSIHKFYTFLNINTHCVKSRLIRHMQTCVFYIHPSSNWQDIPCNDGIYFVDFCGQLYFWGWCTGYKTFEQYWRETKPKHNPNY